ncbi:hypothetical protein K8R30_02140 [archaeon]|nr:hypothetical protein [archaeon]
MNKYLQILIGLVFLLAPIYAWIVDFAGLGTAALTFLKGGVIWILLGMGTAFLVMGISELKD